MNDKNCDRCGRPLAGFWAFVVDGEFLKLCKFCCSESPKFSAPMCNEPICAKAKTGPLFAIEPCPHGAYRHSGD